MICIILCMYISHNKKQPNLRMLHRYLFILAFLIPFSLAAQLYMEGLTGIEPLNLCDCSTGPVVTPVLSIGIAVGNNANPYYLINDTLFLYNVITGNTVITSLLPFFSNNLVFGPDGLLYSIGDDFNGVQSLFTINPNTGAVNNLGVIDNFGPLGDLFFWNGDLYCLAGDSNGNPVLVQVPLGNPNNGAFLFSFPDYSGLMASAVVNLNGTPTVVVFAENLLTGAYGIHTLNMITGELTMLCPDLIAGDLGTPLNYSITCCTNDAGTFSSLAPITLCANESVSPVHDGNEILAPGSSLTFLLLNNNPPALPGNVLATSATPIFAFNPATMTTNTTYYVAAFAAPLSGGVPQWNASCKDLSLLVPVVWKPIPTVQLNAPPAALCENGCTEVILQFTGDLPITLSWTTNSSAGPFSGTWVATATPATFTLCAPAGASFPTGNLPLQWTGISNAFCICE